MNGSREGKGLVLFCRGDDNKGKELCKEEEERVTGESGRIETREQKEEFKGRGRNITQWKIYTLNFHHSPTMKNPT